MKIADRQVLFLFICSVASIFARVNDQKNLHKTAQPTAASLKMIDVNNMAMFVQNNGLFASPGLYYPRDPLQTITDNNLMCTSGLMLGGLIGDSLCTMCSNYLSDALPGSIDENGIPYGKDDTSFRIYKIGTLDSLFNTQDYLGWPAHQGAPVDEYGKPVLLGDQVLWCCFTDGYSYPIGHTNSMTMPLGAKVCQTVYGMSSLDNIIFMRWDISNRSNVIWKNVFVGIFADCELGGAHDDLVGSDSTLALVYDYNSAHKDEIYGSAVPAVGYAFMQTPIVPSPGDTAVQGNHLRPGYKNLPAKSPLYYKHRYRGTPDPATGEWSEFGNMSPALAKDVYLRLQGRSEIDMPMISPITGMSTDWGLSGDPVNGTGWLDQIGEDRRFMLSTGPFDLMPGEIQSITLAILVGHGSDRLNSVTKLRENCRLARAVYRSDAVLELDYISADPVTKNVKIPVRLINPLKALSTLQFDLLYDAAAFDITSVVTTPRSKDFSLVMQENMPGRISVWLDGKGVYSLKGSDPILILKAELKQNATPGIHGVKFTQSTAAGIDNARMNLVALDGKLLINYIPDPVRLIRPADNEVIGSIEQLSHLNFRWSSSRDWDGDSLLYHFTWIGNAYPWNFADTSFSYNGTTNLAANGTYRWTVSVSDGKIEKASPDTFSLTIGDIGRIKLYSDVDLGSANIERMITEGSALYTQSGKIITIYDLSTPTDVQIVRTCTLPDEIISVWGFAVKNGIGYFEAHVGSDIRDKLFAVNLNTSSGNSMWQDGSSPPTQMCVLNNQLLSFYEKPNPHMRAYDLAEPLTPIIKESISLPFHPSYGKILLRNNELFFGGKSSRGGYVFSRYLLNNSLHISDSSSISFPHIKTFAVVNDRAFILSAADSCSNLYTVSLGGSPMQVKTKREILYGRSLVFVNSNYLCVAGDNIEIYNISSDYPVQCAYWPLFGLWEVSPLVAVYNSWIYCWNHWEGNKLRVFTAEFFTAAGIAAIIPDKFLLIQNYPNPFNAGTTIRYSLRQTGSVQISIFDILGNKVRKIKDQVMEAGNHICQWDGLDESGRATASGIYFCQIKTGGNIQTKKMAKLR